MWFFPHCVQADVGSLGFFITVGMDSFVFCLGVVMLKNVSAPAESACPDTLMRRLMFLLPRGSSFSLLACEMHVRFSYIVPLTCSGTVDMPFVLQQGYLQHKTDVLR
jgi:hypothetical protein